MKMEECSQVELNLQESIKLRLGLLVRAKAYASKEVWRLLV